jgi:hypothetical protein
MRRVVCRLVTQATQVEDGQIRCEAVPNESTILQA